MNLNKTQNILLILATALAIVWFGIELSKPNTDECEIAKRMADTNLKSSYDDMDEDNRLIERAGHYANYYEAFCD